MPRKATLAGSKPSVGCARGTRLRAWFRERKRVESAIRRRLASMPEPSLPPLPADPEFCVISRRNDSLDHRRRWSVFALLASVSLIVALSFAVVGAWPVLPYSVLELACLAAAFAIVERRARNWERLTVAGDRVIVESARRRPQANARVQPPMAASRSSRARHRARAAAHAQVRWRGDGIRRGVVPGAARRSGESAAAPDGGALAAARSRRTIEDSKEALEVSMVRIARGAASRPASFPPARCCFRPSSRSPRTAPPPRCGSRTR